MNEYIKILLLTDLFPNNVEKINGIFNHFRASALREAGCDIKIIAPVGITPPEKFVFPSPQIGRILDYTKSKFRIPAVEVIDGFEVVHPKWIWLPRRFFWKYELEFLDMCIGIKMRGVLRNFRPDAVVTSWLHPFGTYAKYIKQILNVPVIAIAEGSDVLINPDKYSGWNKVGAILNKYSNVIVCVSDGMQAVGVQRRLNRLNVIKNCYNDKAFFYSKDISLPHNDGVHILSVGSLDFVKGHDVLLKSMLHFGSHVKLTIIGNGRLLEHYLNFIDINRISNRVQIVPFVENHKIREYMERSDIFCMPSRSEGFPLAPLEALATGLPVVACNVGGLPEIITNGFNGFLCNPDDPHDLSSKLELALDYSWDRKEIAYKAMETYSFSAWANAVLDLIKSETRTPT